MSEQRVTYYKKAQVDSTELTIPEKLKGRYFSYLSSKQVPLFLQTPILLVDSIEGNSIKFLVKRDGQFAQLFKDLDNYVIDYISHRTVQFFRGSLFSRNKIASSFIPTLDEKGCLTVQVHNVDKVLIKDQRDIPRKFADLKPGTESISILNIEGVAFTKKTIRLILTLHQMKIYVKNLLTDWCIFHDSDSEIDDIDVEEAEKEANAIESAYASLQHDKSGTTDSNATNLDKKDNEVLNKQEQQQEQEQQQKKSDLAEEALIVTTIDKVAISSNDDDKDLF